jgi:hypothetical protein
MVRIGLRKYLSRGGDNLEIGLILHLRSEIRNLRLDGGPTSSGEAVQSEISDFGSEMQD